MSIIVNLFETFLPFVLAYVLTYIIFYFIYKKLCAQKMTTWKTSKKYILFLTVFVLCLIGILFVDSFEPIQIYHYLFMGLFTGLSTALIPFVIPVKNTKNK